MRDVEVLGKVGWLGGEKEGEVVNNARWNFWPGRGRVTCLCA